MRSSLPQLLTQEGLDVYVAAGATDAIRLAERYRPRVVVMDLHMGAADTWRAIQGVCGPVALVMTNLLTARQTAERLNAAAYVNHIDLDAVVAAVRGASQSQPTAKPLDRAASVLRSDAELLADRSRRLLDKSASLADEAAKALERAQQRLRTDPAD